MLSITHHTRKRPSTGARSTHGPHTFTRLFSWVLTLEGRSIQVLSGVSELPGVSWFFADIPGLRAVTTLFCVRGYKSPLHPFLPLTLAHFELQSFKTHLLSSLLPLALSW
jgi:hypothetical protein